MLIMKQAKILALLASPLAPSSTAFLALTPTRPFQDLVTQTNQQGLTLSSRARERCIERRVHATRLYGESNEREDSAPTGAWKMPTFFAIAGEAAEFTKCDDSPAGMHPSLSLIDVAAAAAVTVAIMNYLGPLDSASAAATTSMSAELVAQASSVPVDLGAIFAKVFMHMLCTMGLTFVLTKARSTNYRLEEQDKQKPCTHILVTLGNSQVSQLVYRNIHLQQSRCVCM